MIQYKVRLQTSKTEKYLQSFHFWFKMGYEMLNSMKIKEMKNFLRFQGLKMTGKK